MHTTEFPTYPTTTPAVSKALRRFDRALHEAQRATRRSEVLQNAGCVQARYARSSGALVGVYRTAAQGLNPYDGGPWMTTCEDHDTFVQHSTRTLAESWSSCPEGWCEECQQIISNNNPEENNR